MIHQLVSLGVKTKVPKSACVECGTEFDAASGDASPEPNDMTVCIQCGSLNIFDEELRLRAPSVDETFEANKDPRVAMLRTALKMTHES